MPSMQQEEIFQWLQGGQPFKSTTLTLMATAPRNPSPLLNLPTELRLMILDYVINWNSIQKRLMDLKEDSLKREDFIEKLTPDVLAQCHIESRNPLLRSCRQIAMESCSILLQKTLEIPTFLFLSLHSLNLTQTLHHLLRSIRQKLSMMSVLFKSKSLTLNICFRITTWSSNFAKGEHLYALMTFLRRWAARFEKMVTIKVRTINERAVETTERQSLGEGAVVQQQSEDIAFVEKEFLWGLKGKVLLLATHLR
jgi:hypothetical protein